MVTFEMDSGKQIKIEVYPHVAPITSRNFLYLCSIGFYDNTPFHRVIKGFIVQGGSPDGDPNGGPGYSIKGEFTTNGFTNRLKHLRGYVSMARYADENDSGGSQFFIIQERAEHLDTRYAVFGNVVEGMDVIDEIGELAVDAEDRPLELPYIVKVTLDEGELTDAIRPDTN